VVNRFPMSSSKLLLLTVLIASACTPGPPSVVPEAQTACAGADAAGCGRALRALDESCTAGDAASCRAAAALYRQGKGGHVDKSRALSALEHGCEAGDVAACNAAGEGYILRDRAKAERYRQKACDLGSGEGCLYLSGYVSEGDHSPAAAARSEALYQRGVELHVKACGKGEAEGCFGAAVALGRDDGGRATHFYGEASRLWARGCESHDERACYRLGFAYAHEKGVPFDAERAIQLLADACRASVLEACTELGRLYKDKGTAADAVRAAEAFEKACLGGLEANVPCRESAFLYLDGGPVPVDARRAVRLLDNGCALDDEPCCFKLGTLLNAGDGVPQDRARGAALTRSAEGMELRVVEVKRGTRLADPGLTAFGMPESSVPPTVAEPGQELIVVTVEARRMREQARLPVRYVYLVDAAGTLYPNHFPGDAPFGRKPLERVGFMFKVPAGLRPLRLKLELGGLVLDLPPETR
jgi:TPR repeat protein